MTLSQPLIYAYWPSTEKANEWRHIILALIGTALLTLSAKIQIPFWPVPTSLQSFTVVVLAALYGHRLGTATVLLYLFEGAMGLPVFANSSWQASGLAYFLSPTGGYLLGFVLAAYIIGTLSERQLGKTLISAALLFMLGLVIIDISGIAWLITTLGFEKTISIVTSYQLASVFKVGLGTGLLPLLWKRYSTINL
jgi:biotin transport system substrate-specific component